MSVVHYRPDYAKFLFDLPRGVFAQAYTRLCAISHEHKFHGDWLNSHKVHALYCQDPDREVTAIDIWGDWAGIVLWLPWPSWSHALKRFDVRAVVWDADEEAVLAVGQLLQRNLTSHNVEVFSSRPASKRLGRDRGGKGFRIGSRKSDLCLVVYKRHGEPAAQEFRLQNHYLRQAVEQTERSFATAEFGVNRWQHLVERVQSYGERRLTRCFESVGLGVYWPTFTKDQADDYGQLQQSFAARLADIGTDPDAYHSPSEYEGLDEE